MVSVLSLAVRNVWLISGLSGGKLEKTVTDEVHSSPGMIHLPEDEKKHSQTLQWVAQGMYTVATYMNLSIQDTLGTIYIQLLYCVPIFGTITLLLYYCIAHG